MVVEQGPLCHSWRFILFLLLLQRLPMLRHETGINVKGNCMKILGWLHHLSLRTEWLNQVCSSLPVYTVQKGGSRTSIPLICLWRPWKQRWQGVGWRLAWGRSNAKPYWVCTVIGKGRKFRPGSRHWIYVNNTVKQSWDINVNMSQTFQLKVATYSWYWRVLEYLHLTHENFNG